MLKYLYKHHVNGAETWKLDTHQANKLLAIKIDFVYGGKEIKKWEESKNWEIMYVEYRIIKVIKERILESFENVRMSSKII